MPLKCETNLLQDQREFAEFLEIVRKERVVSYLEIGSKHGGSLWRVANAMPKGSRVVSVDLPHGDRSFKESQPHLEACVAELCKRGYDAHLFIGDSTDPTIIERVRDLAPLVANTATRRYGLILIDANHTEPFVRADWRNYGPLGQMVAFHDIGWQSRPEPSKKMPIEVPRVWSEIKASGARTREIKLCPRDNGIGIIWQ